MHLHNLGLLFYKESGVWSKHGNLDQECSANQAWFPLNSLSDLSMPFLRKESKSTASFGIVPLDSGHCKAVRVKRALFLGPAILDPH